MQGLKRKNLKNVPKIYYVLYGKEKFMEEIFKPFGMASL